MKTENSEHVGKHAFEIAGLGIAPFAFVGASENVITYPDGTQQAGGSCDYCGTGIRLECHVRSADGKLSKVGCNCIEKVGDNGLLKAYKNSPEFRERQRKLKQEKFQAARAKVVKFVESNEESLKAKPHPLGFKDFKTQVPLTAWDDVQWKLNNFGVNRIISWAKQLNFNP